MAICAHTNWPDSLFIFIFFFCRNTPLLLCVKKSPDTLVAICEILLANGAEVEQKNRDGENAIDIAKRDKTSAGNKFELALTRHSKFSILALASLLGF